VPRLVPRGREGRASRLIACAYTHPRITPSLPFPFPHILGEGQGGVEGPMHTALHEGGAEKPMHTALHEGGEKGPMHTALHEGGEKGPMHTAHAAPLSPPTSYAAQGDA